ncbi:MAG: signal peptidase I [Bacteroidales bacterium]|nr:signal peptidase I [Bacteroidales bacterium]
MKKRILNIVYWLVLSGILVWSGRLVLKTYVFVSFRVPTNSMEPTVNPDDHVLVNRLAYGRRIFSCSLDSVRHGDITRGWGYSHPQHNDVVVFNTPIYNGWDTISFNKLQFFVKRCIALPGDTFEIRGGYYHVSTFEGDLGNMAAQREVAHLTEDTTIRYREDIPYWTAPFYHPVYHWNIRDMGPLYVPRRGDVIHIDTITAPIYQKFVEWELNTDIEERDGRFFARGEEITEHTMQQGYYFMAGDNVLGSQDSRYWGLVPEEFIVGRVCLVY